MSPFLEIDPSEWIASNRLAFAIRDGFPVSEGHSLVVPKREVAQWWDCTADERRAIFDLVDLVKRDLDDEFAPDGYNIGFNSGAAAGQTVHHVHVHVIPRHVGDVDDPRGGIRHVIPGKGNYLVNQQTTLAADVAPTGGLLHTERIATDRTFGSHAPSRPSEVRLDTGDGVVSSGHQLIDSLGARRLRHELVDSLRSPGFDRVDLVVSFIMKSGLALIADRLDEALSRGARVRVLTTDYMHITDADALTQLLDLSESHEVGSGDLAIRVFSDPLTSFHPKAYLFHSSTGDPARGFVGSSNLSRSGIDGGVEWSLGVAEVDALVKGFDLLWNDRRSQPLNHQFLRNYRQVWRPKQDAVGQPDPYVGQEVEAEPPASSATPRPIQIEGLEALAATRNDGHSAGLVVMATGLGKTWLAAFDSVGFTAPASAPDLIVNEPAGAPGRTEHAPAGAPGRILFVAHREEILNQSRDVFRQVAPQLELGLYKGAVKQGDADVVFASIQTLARNLDQFSPQEFAYIVVDEFHHAAAASYLRVIDHFDPDFLLGLTATPERLDGADLLALCGDNLVFECGLVEGIDRSTLVPFQYWGIKDVVDYAPIPWRNGKFDPQELTLAVETQARAQHTMEQWQTYCERRTLAFCASVTHADFMAEYFTARGVPSVAVHSGPTSSSRVDAVAALSSGEVDVVFTVDVFNEGVDIPEISSVMMLRPTASPVIFLQQLGRGLRVSENKDHLNVVDFVGNHSSFLLKPRILLSLASTRILTQRQALSAMRRGEFSLPEGCSVNFDLEAIDLLASLIQSGTKNKVNALEEYCLETAEEIGTRPTAVQAFTSGVDPRDASERHGSWFGLLTELGLLDGEELRVFQAHGELLRAFEIESINKSYKLVTLRALIADGTLRSGTTVDAVAKRSLRLVLADPRLVLDVRSKSMPEPAEVSETAWTGFWRKNPLDHLAKPTAKAKPLFDLSQDWFTANFVVADELGQTFDRMVAEIVQWRLASYLLRADASQGDESEYELEAKDSKLEAGSHLIGERFNRNQVPEMFGTVYNPGNWQTGHVSLGQDAVLFVTLKKPSGMVGADYIDHFNSSDELVWASQNSVGPDSKKGREVLNSPANGVRIHLFVRSTKSEVAFEYCGVVEPVSHHGEKPMSVTFKLMTPLSATSAKRFGATD